ncbi:MAG: OB-fold nucleic acid binding domain-containing protein [Candidatus Undinarchaeales archaeon]
MALKKVVEMMSKESNLSKEEIMLKIKNKQKELSGLVSEEGAAYIIANELGVRTKNRVIENAVKIENVSEGMKSVTVNGRITRISGPRSFTTKKGREGKVANLTIVDDSEDINIALWKMSDIEKIEKGEIKKGDVIQVRNGYVKPGYRGGLEINLGNRGILVTDPEVEPEKFPEKVEKKNERAKIKDLKAGDSYKAIRSAVVDFYGNNFVYDMCPNCNKKIDNGKCQKCGDVKPDKLAVLNLRLDDGTGSMRASLFRDTFEKFIDMTTEEMDKDEKKIEKKLENLMGSEFLFKGRVKKNDFSGDLEFNAYSTEKVDPEKEAKRILNKTNN